MTSDKQTIDMLHAHSKNISELKEIKCKNCAGSMSEHQSKCDWCGTNYKKDITPFQRINAKVLTAMINMKMDLFLHPAVMQKRRATGSETCAIFMYIIILKQILWKNSYCLYGRI